MTRTSRLTAAEASHLDPAVRASLDRSDAHTACADLPRTREEILRQLGEGRPPRRRRPRVAAAVGRACVKAAGNLAVRVGLASVVVLVAAGLLIAFVNASGPGLGADAAIQAVALLVVTKRTWYRYREGAIRRARSYVALLLDPHQRLDDTLAGSAEANGASETPRLRPQADTFDD